MGVAQNALLGAGASVGVAASKFATNIKAMKGDKPESAVQPVQVAQAVDADRAEQAEIQANYQKEKLKNMKLKNKNLRMRNRMLKDTLKKNQEVKPNEQK